jgi:hypothetical protein
VNRLLDPSFADEQPRGSSIRRRLHRLSLLIRTALMLQPAQIAQRVRIRSQRKVLSRSRFLSNLLIRPSTPHVRGWPLPFLALDSKCPPIPDYRFRDDSFLFLGDERGLGTPADWQQLGASQLWRFHLHYFEWAWTLAAEGDAGPARDEFGRLWRSWASTVTFPRGDPWSPYVVALRAWSLCGVYDRLVAGSDVEDSVVCELARHAAYLRAHLELDVGGNHLIKNLKALFGLGIFLGQPRLVEQARRHLSRQLDTQILADGGHFERSPSYHCQVLGDLIDIRALLGQAGLPRVSGLDESISGMRDWLGAMIGPDGDVPLFNDAAPVGAARLGALEPSPAPAGPLIVLAASGYVVVRWDPCSQAVLDVGDPCPDELPAHAHADCLSFELWVAGRRVVLDGGTSTYERGDQRDFERSTAAHNTVEVDGADQTEVWSSFRAARRARGCLELAVQHGAAVEVVASHNGYRRLPGSPVHRRRWSIAPGHVDIDDVLLGGGRHRLTSRLRFDLDNVSACRLTSTGGAYSTEPSTAAQGFGRLDPVTLHTLRADIELPHEMGWSLRWAPAIEGGQDGDQSHE